MSIIRLELPKPHQAQIEIIQQSKRFNVVACGRRFGKTILGMDRLLRPALEGKPTAWFAPNYRLLQDVWRELKRRLYPVQRDVSEQERRLELVGGGTVEMWSLDSPDAGRGRAYAEIVIDEAAMIAELESAWQDSIRPMLTDYQGGAWFLSTPKGIASYFHTLFQRGRSDPTWASWQMPTSRNPFIAADEIEAARGDLTDLAFRQEYLAEFVSWAGAVFRRITDAVSTKTPTLFSTGGVIGVDWGRTTDFTVFVSMNHLGEVLEIDRFRGMEFSLQRERLKAFWARNARYPIVAESNSIGLPVIEQLQSEGCPIFPFLTTNQSKAQAIEGLALAFERSAIQIPNDAALLGELQSFEATRLPSGMMRYAAPSGGHDDMVIALAIAWYALAMKDQPPREQRIVLNDPMSYRISAV